MRLVRALSRCLLSRSDSGLSFRWMVMCMIPLDLVMSMLVLVLSSSWSRCLASSVQMLSSGLSVELSTMTFMGVLRCWDVLVKSTSAVTVCS